MGELAPDDRFGGEIGLAVAGEEVPVNPYSLLEAVNDASEISHTGWIVFLLVVAYLLVAVAGVTHEHLLLNSAVELPILQIAIELTRFFLFVPIFLVLLHFGLLVQHVMLARKVLEFHAALRPLEPSKLRSHPLRLELHPYFFTQTLAGPERSAVVGAFLHGMIWATIVILPVLVILYIQIAFLPYHDVATTWMHRTALIVDILLLFMLGVFLRRRESSFFRAFWRVTHHHPMHVLVTTSLFLCAVLFSFFVATIPDEGLDRITRRMPGQSVSLARKASADDLQRPVFALTAWLFEGRPTAANGGVRSIFQRNLVVTDEDIVKDGKDGETGSSAATVLLRDRDLRFATLDRSDLHGADMTGANLEGASLVGTDLRHARMSCADVEGVLRQEKSRETNCANLQGADFSRSKLSGADLRFAYLSGALFPEADLAGANLRFAELIGVDFDGADLRRATFYGTELMGASFLQANMHGADLTGAKMHGTDFSRATLQAAQLNFAQAFGTNFSEAQLDGANMLTGKLFGASFSQATLRGTDFSGAIVWQSEPPDEEKLSMADLSSLQVRTVNAGEMKQIDEVLGRIRSAAVRERVARTLANIKDTGESEIWQGSPAERRWERAREAHTGAAAPGYRNELTGYLGTLSCQTRYSDGAVASGVIRRAVAGNFKGDVGALYRTVTGAGCPAATTLSGDLLQQLAAQAELLRSETGSIAPLRSEPAAAEATPQ